MKRLFGIICILLPLAAIAQVDTLWTKTYRGKDRDFAFSIIRTNDNGFLMMGNSDSFGPYTGGDMYAVRLDAEGTKLWGKTYSGHTLENCNAAVELPEGGFILVGYTLSYGAGGTDCWVIGVNARGDSLWSRFYGGSEDDKANAIVHSESGEYLIVGRTESFGSGSLQPWVIMINSEGDSLWSSTLGIVDNGFAQSVVRTDDGGFVILGRSGGEIWLAKIDADGNNIWNRSYGGHGNSWAWEVKQVDDGGFIIAASTSPSVNVHDDFWMLRTDSEGNILWSRTFGGSGMESGFSVCETGDDGFVMVGTTWPNSPPTHIMLAKASSDGDSLWSTVLRGGIQSSMCRSMLLANDGGYYLGGYCTVNDTDGVDFMLMKTTIDSTNLGNFSPVSFLPIIITDEISGIVDLAVGDIGWDGDMDVAAVDMFADQVVAFENLDMFEYQLHTIDDGFDGACAIDIGFIDEWDSTGITACGRFETDIRTYAYDWSNTWTFNTQTYWSDSLGKNDITTIDSCQRLQFSSSVEGKVIWWEVDHPFVLEPHDLSLGDCDVDQLTTAYIGDGPIDIIGSSRETGKVYWWDGETDGSFTEHVILNGVYLNCFDIADMNRDLRKDLLCAKTSGEIVWYENIGGEELIEHEITNGMQYPFDIKAVDINLDGFMDFVIADSYADEISWWRNSGNGYFRRNILASDFTQARAIEIIDFDGDSDPDIIAAGQNGIVLWMNLFFISDEIPSLIAKDVKPDNSDEDIVMETQDKNEPLPTEFALHPNHPNPFNPTTTISFSLPIRSEVTLTVHDVLGRTTETLVSGSVEAGNHSLNWSCPECATGVYFIAIQAGKFQAVQKALLIK